MLMRIVDVANLDSKKHRHFNKGVLASKQIVDRTAKGWIHTKEHKITAGLSRRGPAVSRIRFPESVKSELVAYHRGDNYGRALHTVSKSHTHYAVNRNVAYGAGALAGAVAVGGGVYAYRHRKQLKRKAGQFTGKQKNFISGAHSAHAHQGTGRIWGKPPAYSSTPYRGQYYTRTVRGKKQRVKKGR